MPQITADSLMPNQNIENKEGIVCPESTIDSAPRRDFIRKTALSTAGVGVGATALGKNFLPLASASSSKPDCCCGYFGNLFAGDCLYPNTTVICCCEGPFAITFGSSSSGEAIHSQRIGGRPCCNQYGIDFVTDYTKRLRIRNCGKVGIGTTSCCTWVTGLTVKGNVSAGSSIISVNCGNGSGAVYGYSTYNSCSGPGVGVYGKSVKGTGVQAQGCKTFAVSAATYEPLVGRFENVASSGDKSAVVQFGIGDCKVCTWNAGVAGKCDAIGVTAGNFYLERVGQDERLIIDTSGSIYPDPTSLNKGDLYCGPSLVFGGLGSGEGISSNRHSCNPNQYGLDFYTDSPPSKPIGPRVSITNAGNLGIGTRAPGTNLQVVGSFGAKIATVSSNYVMGATDFAILANASSSGLSVTLPPAKTGNGMIVYVKKIDSSAHAVTVEASGSDQIEGKTSESLSAVYSGLTLISDGTSNWYVVGGST